jgi:hypothetical protein
MACWVGGVKNTPQPANSQTSSTTTTQLVSPPTTQPSILPSETIPILPRANSHMGARIFIVEPVNGAEVTSPVTVKFGADAIAIEPAGEVKDNSGHYHLLIDTEELPAMDQPLPFSDRLLHFGQAQKEAVVNLAPGKHTLQLVLAGGNHVPHNPPVVSEKITITVK